MGLERNALISCGSPVGRARLCVAPDTIEVEMPMALDKCYGVDESALGSGNDGAIAQPTFYDRIRVLNYAINLRSQ